MFDRGWGGDVLGGRFIAHKEAQRCFYLLGVETAELVYLASVKLLVASYPREDCNHTVGGRTLMLNCLPVESRAFFSYCSTFCAAGLAYLREPLKRHAWTLDVTNHVCSLVCSFFLCVRVCRLSGAGH